MTALEVAPEPLRSFANILVEVCAYAGTGNVLKIQQLLHICSEPPKEEVKTDTEKQKAKVLDVEELLADEINSSAVKNTPPPHEWSPQQFGM